MAIYWLKNQIDINLSESVSLSKYIPFIYFQRSDVINSPDSGFLFSDSFEKYILVSNWSSLWMEDEDQVIQSIDSKGIKNSRCLLINSNSNKSWSYSHRLFFEVKEGDVFEFTAFVRIEEENVSASVGIGAFDKNIKAIKWNYIKENVLTIGRWVKIEKKFTILDNIKFIRFRLTGTGRGEFRFDDIIFKKN